MISDNPVGERGREGGRIAEMIRVSSGDIGGS